MSEPGRIEIKIKPIVKKAEKGRLPAKVGADYPTSLLVVYFEPDALGRLKMYAASNLDYELGGVLVGKVGKSSRRAFVVVSDFIPATLGISRRASFEFTNESQQEIHEVKEQKFNDLRILGWFHTHPGYGIFLSGTDQFTDGHYFKEKYHVAVVLDPTRPDIEMGVFVWEKNQQRVRVPFFELV